MGNIRDYFFNKLIFSRILIVDHPGVIINRCIKRISKKYLQTRVIYCFEDFIVDLYGETRRRLGKNRADLLWYKISKNSGIRYAFFSQVGKVPDFLVRGILRHIFDIFSGIGMTFAQEFDCNVKDRSIVTRGRNCVICRKIGSGCIAAGNLSALWSSMVGENIEAEALCSDCPNRCKIVANRNISKKYDVNYEELRPMKGYDLKNFNIVSHVFEDRFASLSAFLKFGKIKYDGKSKIFYFHGLPISYSEIGMLELIPQEYIEMGHFDLFKDILLKSSERLIRKMNFKNMESGLREMESFLSAFGWGIFVRKKLRSGIGYKIINPPICKYPPILRSLIINGFLNGIFQKNFIVSKMSNEEFVFSESSD